MKGFSLLLRMAALSALAISPASLALGQAETRFMSEAAAANMAEVDLAELASRKAADEEVRQYAEHLLGDHRQAHERLKALANEKQVRLPGDLSERHKRTRDKLSLLEGPEFDRAYVDAMIADHRKTLAEFRKAAAHSADEDVKTFAAENIPALEEHLERARKLQSRFNASAKS